MPSRQINEFSQKGDRKKIVSGQTWCQLIRDFYFFFTMQEAADMSVAEDKAVGAGEGQQSKEQFRDFFKTYNKMSEVRECNLPYRILKLNIYLTTLIVTDVLQPMRVGLRN